MPCLNSQICLLQPIHCYRNWGASPCVKQLMLQGGTVLLYKTHLLQQGFNSAAFSGALEADFGRARATSKGWYVVAMAKVSFQHVSCSVPPTPVLSQQLLRGSRDMPLLSVSTRSRKSEFHDRRGGAINCSCAKSSPCAYPLPPLVPGKSRSLNPQFRKHSHKQRNRHLGRVTPDFDGFDTSEMFAANQKAPEEEERGGIQIGAESLPNLVPEDMDEITDEMRAVQPPGLCFSFWCVCSCDFPYSAAWQKD
jgi:hypothetical protein